MRSTVLCAAQRVLLLASPLFALPACAPQSVELRVEPEAMLAGPATSADPVDPFQAQSASSAYGRLRSGTDAARATPWDGSLQSFGAWLETQTQSMEERFGELAELRTGPRDQYAVANGRVALAYEHVATNLDAAAELAEQTGLEADWADLGPVLWERAHRFWERCVHMTAAAAPHLDAWKLRCSVGASAAIRTPARQAK